MMIVGIKVGFTYCIPESLESNIMRFWMVLVEGRTVVYAWNCSICRRLYHDMIFIGVYESQIW